MATLNCYTGFWWDYSIDGVGAGVLTLPITSAGHLISGLALLVSLSGTAFWVIVAYIWHQIRVSPGGPVDYEHLQLQILLRNTTSPAAAVFHAAKIYLAQRKTKISRVSTLLVLTIVAGLVFALFSAAGVLVGGLLASRSQDEILALAKPVLCGSVISVSNSSESAATFSATVTYLASSALRGRAYAKAWYSQNTSVATTASSIFPVHRLPYTTSQVPCPFTGSRCRFHTHNTSDANTALALDTGLLDSHLHFGINGPVHRSVQFRRKAICMPFRAADLFELQGDIDGTNFTILRAGRYQDNDGNITQTYDERMPEMDLGYVIG
jgi:hypothetical protein